MSIEDPQFNKNDVFLGGIPIDSSSGKLTSILFLEEMTEYLERFGKVESCRLTINKNGVLKGFGFARF